MRKEVLLLIARQFWVIVFKSKAIYLLFGLMAVLLCYAAYSGVAYHTHNHFRENHQKMARESWEANPDKHPHRMAHFGTFAFRPKHSLSTFDFGIEHFTGNVIFLEAHRQNTVNFSEASFSTSLIRFGELSMAMILQIILPLIIFFIGYAAIVSDRENGTLKILLTQGASWKEVLYGKTLGLFSIGCLFYFPYIICLVGLLMLEEHAIQDDWVRLFGIAIAYLFYTAILSSITIIISVSSTVAKSALVKLLGVWFLLVIILPASSQSIGSYLYQTPNKLEFRNAIEEEVIQFGDSHDANDAYYQEIRDSVLQVYQVSSTKELPFNYGGFQMGLGEKISTEIYQKHQRELLNQYKRQNQLTRWLAMLNPYLGIKHLSMALCGTDLNSYIDFQNEAEAYRYNLSQRMNKLQMDHIKANVASSEGKVNVIGREEWKAIPDFSYEYSTVLGVLYHELMAIISILVWIGISIATINYWSRKASAL